MKEQTKIFVTGLGIVSPIGTNSAQNLQSLRNSSCGIGKANYLRSNYTSSLLFGEVKLSNQELISNNPCEGKGITRTNLLALQAFNEAVMDAGIGEKDLQDRSTCFLNADTVGGMCLTEQMYEDANNKSGGSEYLRSYDFAACTLFIEEQKKLRGITNTINTACSSSANAILMGARLLQQARAKTAIVGGCDSLAKFTVNGFNSLGILTEGRCAPFSENRKGLNLGEGAAYLVLEREQDCRNKRVYAELTGFANTNDAYHPSSLSPEGDGPYLAMKQALQMADLDPKEIGYINVHGTGTENNDLVEGLAMKKLFGNVPPFSSTKSFTGHTLGAAGAVEAVFSLFGLQHQELYPSLNFSAPVLETGLIPQLSCEKKKLNHVLSNSFGFGGNCTSLLFSAV